MSNAQMERMLVVTDDPSAEADLRPRLEELAGTRNVEVKIVAPMRSHSGLDLLTGDVDDSIDEAQERADESAEESDEADSVDVTQVEVGDADQLLAIEDALATFEADRIVIVDPDEDLLEEAQKRFDLPIARIATG